MPTRGHFVSDCFPTFGVFIWVYSCSIFSRLVIFSSHFVFLFLFRSHQDAYFGKNSGHIKEVLDAQLDEYWGGAKKE